MSKENIRRFAGNTQAFLDTIFDGLMHLETHSNEPAIKIFGPDDEANVLYRGRHSFEHADLINAMARPDLCIGPPPADKAASIQSSHSNCFSESPFASRSL